MKARHPPAIPPQPDVSPYSGVRYEDWTDPTVLTWDEAYVEVFAESLAAAEQGDYSMPADRRAILGRMRESKQRAWRDFLEHEAEAADAGWYWSDFTGQWEPPVESLDDPFENPPSSERCCWFFGGLLAVAALAAWRRWPHPGWRWER